MALGDYYEFEEDEVQTTTEEREESFQELHEGQTWAEYYEEQGFGDGVSQQGADAAYFASQEADEHAKAAARERMGREKYNLTGDKIYARAQELEAIASGKQKTQGQLDVEQKLKLLTQGQRGQAASYGGFDAARALENAARGAQQTELTGDALIDEMATKARRSAKENLEELLIAGEQQAENKALAMENIAWQREQADKSMWSNVLGGIFAAIGTGVGFMATAGASTAVQVAAMGLGAGVGRGGGEAAGSFS